MVNPSTSRAERVACASAIMTKFEKIRGDRLKNVMRNREKGSILDKYLTGQEEQLKQVIKLMAKWSCQKHPIRYMNNTYYYNLSHIYRVIEYQYLSHIYAYQMRWCKCPISCYIWTSKYENDQNHPTCRAWPIQELDWIWEILSTTNQLQRATLIWCWNLRIWRICRMCIHSI